MLVQKLISKTWLNILLDILIDKEMSLVKYFPTDTKLIFRNGVEFTSTEKLKFLAIINRKRL